MNRPFPESATVPANSVRRALAILGDRWTLLILRDAFLGVQQFGDWQARLGVARTVLTRRLKRLVKAGIFRRVPYREVPPRVEYRLTEKGRDTYGIALMVLRWERRWFGTPGGPAVVLRHTRCGNAFEPRFTCAACGDEVTARDVRYADGPGAGSDPAPDKRLHRRAATTAGDSRGEPGFLEHAIDIIGDRWTAEVVAAAFFGRRRFDAIQAEVGIATNILADRLHRLTADGLLARRPYQERPLRHEYVLTPKGFDLYALTVMLMRWGDRWLSEKGPPLVLTHKTCGKPFEAQITCSGCGEAIDPHEVKYEVAEPQTQSTSP
jgi:DNA-binding HxlR family transcriptional regulator